jgi:uncharacterized protein (DUF3084 family)
MGDDVRSELHELQKLHAEAVGARDEARGERDAARAERDAAGGEARGLHQVLAEFREEHGAALSAHEAAVTRLQDETARHRVAALAATVRATELRQVGSALQEWRWGGPDLVRRGDAAPNVVRYALIHALIRLHLYIFKKKEQIVGQ